MLRATVGHHVAGLLRAADGHNVVGHLPVGIVQRLAQAVVADAAGLPHGIVLHYQAALAVVEGDGHGLPEALPELPGQADRLL